MGKKKSSITVTKLDQKEICFDLVNSDFPFANAIRRILLAEVPTMAIDKVHLLVNTSEMPDFALCHRLALVPIQANPDRFEMKQENEEQTEHNTLKMTIQVQCPADFGSNMHVYSNAFRWEPLGNQIKTLADDPPIQPVESDILVMKLAPSQKIEAAMFCSKGVGKDHAKFCPVAACFYRCLTEFHFADNEQLTNEELNNLKLFFPKGYFNFDKIDQNGFPQIIQNRFQRSDFSFQSCPSLKDKILFETKPNVLCFTIESIGMINPDKLVLKSIDILQSKCTKFLKAIYPHID